MKTKKYLTRQEMELTQKVFPFYEFSMIKLVMLSLILCILFIPQMAKSQTECRWSGTAPSCNGSCGVGESEITRLGFLPGGYPPYYYGPDFGKPCISGSKALCCKTPGRTCRWDGTAPFCEGSCNSGEKESQPPAGSSGGKACWTGKKVYCCSSTGSSQSPLTAKTESPLYAAIWEKHNGPAWVARHDMKPKQYQQEFDKLVKQGYRLVDVSGFSVGGQQRFAAIWEKRKGPAWVARHGMDSAQYQQEFNALTKKGYRLTHVSGYGVGSEDRYAAIWEKSRGPSWVARHGMTSNQYQKEFNKLTKKGYRLTHVSGYNAGGEDRYAAIWEKGKGPKWKARHGMTSDQYQKEFNKTTKKGYRLTHVSSWRSGKINRYAAIWEKDQGPAWVARHHMTSAQYQQEFNKLVKQGYRLKDVSGSKRAE